jgi:hypothetical protein
VVLPSARRATAARPPKPCAVGVWASLGSSSPRRSASTSASLRTTVARGE